jgi:glutamyl-tRNA reductase
MAKSIIESLYKSGIRNINAINRSIKTINITESFNVMSMPLSSSQKYLEEADIVIASATTSLPIIGKGALESALRARKNKPILLIDLAVPRNIEPEIKSLEQVYLFSIDDIEKITKDNFGERVAEAEKASNLIVQEVQIANTEIINKIKKRNLKKDLEELINLLSEDDISLLKKNVLNNIDLDTFFIKKAKEEGISKAIEGIQDFNKSSVKEIIKGLINNA